ncbi:G surface protein, allelic form 168-like [Mercenaria mercenaria]|uniref:G surface protein, allelic form 168-like n=1 Tax=Mercenaria mercenaria TaxID=6596 RepID=UPI00234E6701|nr:G surface protein, allelic form 168-like [Mercenaria mercenaria]
MSIDMMLKLFVAIGLSCHLCVAAVPTVSQTACTANGNECSGIPNSACVSTKCKCNAGFIETTTTCTKAVSGTSCTKSGNECSSIANSACDVTNSKCKCDSGFKETVNKCTAKSKATTVSTTTITTLFGATLLVFAFRDLF